ncbi:MAG: hypothetical protein HOV80_12170 [Polyangiaceae bacterium]|nr:hypothetical protein [Polyangiaceae bacterium]
MATVRLQSASSSSNVPEKAAEEALTGLGSFSPKVVFGFVPGPWDHRAFHAALRARLPKAIRLVTSSSGGEITNEGLATEKLVLGAIGGDLDVSLGWATDLSRDAAKAGSTAIEMAAQQLGTRVANLDRHYGAVVIEDGFKMKKEEMLLGVLEKNQSLVLVGGGASGYEFMKGSGFMGVDGDVFSDGVVTMLFRSTAPWAALRSHWYEPTGQRTRLTKVDVPARRILELDGKPAGARWAEIAGVPPEHLTFANPEQFLRSSLAMRVGREYFLRSIAKRMDDDTLDSANMVQEDLELEVMRVGNIVDHTRRFFAEEIPRRVANPTAALLFDCGARRLYAHLTGKVPELSRTFAEAPHTAGLTVQFETYCGFMVNSTLTALVFGSNS